MSSYIPTNDLEFSSWMENFLGYVTANLAHFGLVEADVEPLIGETTGFQTAFTDYRTKREATKTASRGKKEARTDLETELRAMVARVQAYPETTNLDRESLGIPVRGTGGSPQSIEFEDNKPHPVIDIRQRFNHVLRIENQSTLGTSKAKPKGVKHAEIWIKIGGDSEDMNGYVFYGVASKSPHPVKFDPSDANKLAHYRLRWVSTKNEPGAWSEAETATIAA